MSYDVPVDSLESDSMAKPVSSAEVDGWEVESSSAVQPTNEELAQRLSEEPAEQTEPPESVDEDHDDAIGDEGAAAQASEPEPQKKRKESATERTARIQAEINALTRQRHEEERALEALRRERTTFAAPPPAPKPPTEPPASATAEPDWDQYEADGKSFTQFSKDHSKWMRDTVTAEVETRAQRAADTRIEFERQRLAGEAVLVRHETRPEQVKAAHPDFDAAIANLDDPNKTPLTPFIQAVVMNHPKGAEFLYHLGLHPDEASVLAALPMTRPIMDAVRESDDPTPLLLHFAQHPEEHDRIAHLDPGPALLALGRLSAALSGPGAKNGSPVRTPSLTTAKPPIRPLGTTRTASTSRDADDLEFGPEYARRALERERQQHA
jgi:hypothetical protein